MILFLVSFIAGLLTVLAPCVLPLLPVIVGGSLTTGSHRRAYVICVALGGSVLIFTLLLKASTAFISFPQSFWEIVSGGILIVFGVVMIFPSIWDSIPVIAKLNLGSNRLLATGYQRDSLWGDMLMGAALGPVFASCSPTYFVILATVLPASFAMGFADLLAYVIGLSGFLLVIAIAGQRLVDRLNVTIEPGGWFRRAIGILFLIVGIAVATGTEASAERWLLSHGFDVTSIEQLLLKSSESHAQCTGRNCVDSFATSTEASSKSLLYPKAPELVSPDGYVNTDGKPITIEEFKGKKVVLIDIWTYSCINCQRTLPYIKMWYEKYHDQGLQIIGVHTPEFAFEKVFANVQRAVQEFGLKYPIVLDNEYRTWNAFDNHFWPRKYLVDIDGYIVYDHAGEGNYEETEAAIQKALAERARRLGTGLHSLPEGSPAGEVSVDFSKVRSPEVYFGSARNEFLGNGSAGKEGTQTFQIPDTLRGNTLYLGGQWSIEPEYAQTEGEARIDFIYSAKNVYFVASDDSSAIIEVFRDGKLINAERGGDVDGNGRAIIGEERLYKLIEGSDYGDHLLEIRIHGKGLKAYTFTFG